MNYLDYTCTYCSSAFSSIDDVLSHIIKTHTTAISVIERAYGRSYTLADLTTRILVSVDEVAEEMQKGLNFP